MNLSCHHISVELHHGDVIVIDTQAECVRAMTRALQGRVYKHGEVLEVFFAGLTTFDENGVCVWKAKQSVTPSVNFNTDDATGVISVSWYNWESIPQEVRDWANKMVAEAWDEATRR